MKGIVLEIRNRTAAVLREDGVIVKTRQKCAVGDTIELSAEKIRFPSVRSVAAAAAAVIVIGGGSGIYTYENVMACSYVSLDVNPSLELVLNRQNRVIKVNACDDEAESVVEAIKEQNIKNMKVDEALETAYDVLKENGYIEEDNDNYLLFNVSSDEKSRTETLTGKIETVFGEKEGALAVTTESSLKDRDKARELGISAGKYSEIRMIEESVNPESVNMDAQTVDRYSGMTVRECMEEAGQIPRHETAGSPADPASPVQPAEEVPKDSGAVQQPGGGTQMIDGSGRQSAGGTQMTDGTGQQSAGGTQMTDSTMQQPGGGAQENANPPQHSESMQQTPAATQQAAQSSGGVQGNANTTDIEQNMQSNPDGAGAGQNAAPVQNEPAVQQQGTGAMPGNSGTGAAAAPQQPGLGHP